VTKTCRPGGRQMSTGSELPWCHLLVKERALGDPIKQNRFEQIAPYLWELVRSAAAEAGSEIGDLATVAEVMDQVYAVLCGQRSIADTGPYAPHVWTLLKQLARFPRCGDHQGVTMIPHVRQGQVQYAHRLPSGRLCYGRACAIHPPEVWPTRKESDNDTTTRAVVRVCLPDAETGLAGRVQVLLPRDTEPNARPTVIVDIVVPWLPQGASRSGAKGDGATEPRYGSY
jgi:hypothetical protein